MAKICSGVELHNSQQLREGEEGERERRERRGQGELQH